MLGRWEEEEEEEENDREVGGGGGCGLYSLGGGVQGGGHYS